MGADRRPTAAAALGATVLAAAAWRQALALVSCTSSPDCKARNREDCNPLGDVPNACGNCFLGSFGGQGPTNSYCLSNKTCGAVYPGMSCPIPVPGLGGLYTGSQLPLLLPFGTCVCDKGDGLRWPTAPGACARTRMAFSDSQGTGIFQVEKCTSKTCEESTCTVLKQWLPPSEDPAANSFDCLSVGSDAFYLSNDCGELVGETPDSAFCGHPGLVNEALESVQQYILRCNIAPKCPASVLQENLEQTCCEGNLHSFSMGPPWGEAGKKARGFCAREIPTGSLVGRPVFIEVVSAAGLRNADKVLQGNSDPFCTGEVEGRPSTRFQTGIVEDVQDPIFNYQTVLANPEPGDVLLFNCWDRDYGEPNDMLGSVRLPSDQWQEEGFTGELDLTNTGGRDATLKLRIMLLAAAQSNDCGVRTFATGWRGCACMAPENNLPQDDRVCTMTCTLPGCGADDTGIPPTPERWRTQAVPDSYRRPDRGDRHSNRFATAYAARGATTLGPLLVAAGAARLLAVVFLGNS